MRIQAEVAVTYTRVEDQRAETLTHAEQVDFVAREVEGVFQAIVESSIQQMEAYADLLASVTKTVDEFRRDEVDDDDDDP